MKVFGLESLDLIYILYSFSQYVSTPEDSEVWTLALIITKGFHVI